MKTTKEKIEVMQAYVDGKQIQVWLSTTGWTDIVREPCWEWSDCDYRIKPEPKEPTYRPYESVEEMVADYDKRFGNHGRPKNTMPLIWVRHRGDGSICLLTTFPQTEDMKCIFDTEFDFHEYLDGTPFGKLVE